MWFISTYNPRTNATINTTTYTVATPCTAYIYDTFHTILQLTTFGPWKRVDLFLHPLGRSCNPNPTPPCLPLDRDGHSAAHITSYPRWLLEHAYIRIVFFSAMRSNPPHSTSQMVCAIPQPLPPRTMSVLMESPCGRGVRQRGGSGAVCRQTDTWEVGRKNVIGILVKAKKEGKTRKIPVLATLGSTPVLFG